MFPEQPAARLPEARAKPTRKKLTPGTTLERALLERMRAGEHRRVPTGVTSLR